MQSDSTVRGLSIFWKALGGDSDDLKQVRITRPDNYLPSAYDVSGMAAALVSGASLAVAELRKVRLGLPKTPDVLVDGLVASAAFRSEALFEPIGWKLPEVWDPIAGDYLAKDRWIRLHTNYANHKEAALSALGLSVADRASVAAAVRDWDAAELERAVLVKGGCAAAMYTESEWAGTVGRDTLTESLVQLEPDHSGSPSMPKLGPNELPLSGVRVIDLTRVIAGPECTRFLAAWGADVLRIDPPGFQEVPAVVPDVTIGKRCAFLDFSDTAAWGQFETLVKNAHVLVLGYRSEALSKFGLSLDRLHELNPNLIVARLNAYGWTTSFRERRGFDSLVQMSAGIAARGAALAKGGKPVPLPAQALDHGAGYALAAGVCRALSELWTHGRNCLVSASLIGVANFLKTEFRDGSVESTGGKPDFGPALVEVDTDWGKAKRVIAPGCIDGIHGCWSIRAGKLGRHPAEFPGH